MKIQLKAKGLSLTEPLKEYTLKKVGMIGKFVRKWDRDDSLIADVEVARTTRHHRKGLVYYAEVTLRLPGKVLRAQQTHYDIRTAIDRARDKLKREVNKYRTVHAHQT